ncbi:MAG: glycosyltransferase family 1 protein [Microbacteriaceae bacterium]|nr:glycosyltransferase family 1 protein [Microbacteriaceae bacterium]
MTNSKIGFDCRYIRPNSQDGISRFSIGLFTSLSKMLKLTAIINDPRQLESLPEGTEYITIHAPTSPLEPFASMRLNKHNFSVVFSPMQTIAIGSLRKRHRLILTIHDLIFYSHPAPPAYFNFFIRLLWRVYHASFLPQKLLLRRADEVVTVSETSKRLIIENKLTSKAVTVVPNATNGLAYENLPVEKKIVYMGSFMPYKNVEDLIRATAELEGYHLLLLSKITDRKRDELSSLAKKLSVTVEFADGVSDDEYAQHLSTATALVHASSDEGFGIPIIEAMSVGCPVVCSDIPIFREIAGSAGLFFEIGNHKQFAEQVKKAHQERAIMRESLINQARKFDWEQSAKRLAELLV